MVRFFRILLDFTKQAGVAVAFAVAAVTDPLKWPQAFGLLTEYHWVISTEARRAIFLAIAFLWMFVWYYRTRVRYDEENTPKFRVTIQEIGFNGTPIGSPPRYFVFAVVSVKNLGKIASALPTWQVIIRGQGGQDVKFTPTIFPGSVTLGTGRGGPTTYPESSMIANKTLDPLAEGSIKHGYIAADSLESWFGHLGPQHSIVVRCWDVFDNSYEASRQINTGDDLSEGRYFPGMGQLRGKHG